MPIREIRVEEVKPTGEERKARGVQVVKIVAILEDGTRYSAKFYRDRNNKMRTSERFRNGYAFDEEGHISIPQTVFSAMTKKAAAVMFER